MLTLLGLWAVLSAGLLLVLMGEFNRIDRRNTQRAATVNVADSSEKEGAVVPY